MGYMKHDAIVVTSWNGEAIFEAAAKARGIGLQVVGPSDEATNGYRSFLVCPDGSKEGWDESCQFHLKREKYIDYLNTIRYEDGGSCLHWVAIEYSEDNKNGRITARTWQQEEVSILGI